LVASKAFLERVAIATGEKNNAVGGKKTRFAAKAINSNNI